MTTIIQKYGFGTPDNGELAKAEIGVDLTDGILYSSTDGNDIIELGRGEISWENITGKPPTIDPDDGDNYVDLTALEARVGVNEVDIAALKAAVADLESDLAALEGKVDKNTENIAANAGNISTNTNNISTLDDQINADGGLADKIEENTTNIGLNKDEIDKLKDLLDANLTGLVMGGEYDASINQVSKTTAAGEAAGLEQGQSLPTGEGTKGIYVIVTKEGVLANTGGSPARSDGDTAHVGDWLVSDGIHGWILFSFGMDAVNWGMIGGDIESQEDLMAKFDEYIKHTDTINCGTYTTTR